ncbi:MAG: hypothetical protein A3H96_07675 [Acidobacteria bacterium RIFCSPLOWO2_02_FULL_67_36]|nr:MAG: hypothetical protein A3H96_07675 [Acidobacteria bacterium RIFCSPLOWO2_02_FULL_67_36]OFW23614.1 MAG: hypothetical protein A3G21_06745 [Acidobacteria bacterium RIFCSPLOWO2_12_FULL_66_21]
MAMPWRHHTRNGYIEMILGSTDNSPQVYARIGGILYLIIIVAGTAGELFVRGSLVVSGNAAATANNILASRYLWRAGVAGDLLMHVCDVGLMLVLYVLLRPVSRNLALLAILFNLVQTAVLVANKLNLVLPLLFLADAAYLKAFTPEQLQAFSYVAIRTHGYGFAFGLIFFGIECVVIGYLIFRSGYLPKALGVMMQIAGVCYVVNSFAFVTYPPIASKLFPVILLPPFVAELSVAVWLLVKGVDLRKWPAASVPSGGDQRHAPEGTSEARRL